MSFNPLLSFIRPSFVCTRSCARVTQRLTALTLGATLGGMLPSTGFAGCPSSSVPSGNTPHLFGTIRLAPVPEHFPADPDWLTVLETNAARAVASGLWDERIRASVALLRERAAEPRFPIRRPMAHTSMLIEKPTEVDAKTSHAAYSHGTLAGFARTYLLFDETNDVQRRFARRIVEKHPAEAGLRPIVSAGSVARARELLDTRVWADQGSVLTRRLGLTHWPALVRLTPERLTLWMPALNPEGEPIGSIPTVFTEGLVGPTRARRQSFSADQEVRS